MLMAKPANRLLESLPQKERNRILKLCKPVELESGVILFESDQVFRHVYFPLTSFISLVVTVGGHPPLEVELIGNEGMLGITLMLGVNTAPLRAVVQGPGSALQMTAAQLRRALSENSTFSDILNRYLYVRMAQLSQTAACSRFHEVEARLARWLLMTHDRTHTDYVHHTHQFLADMLGVQRSAVTIAAGVLQKRKLIRYIRGEIKILDRKGLESASCECYDAVIDDYAQLLT